MPTPPPRVTATCVQTPVASAAGPLMRCSPPEPLEVLAKRAVPLLELGVKNILAVVPVPKSNSRRQLPVVSSRTQVATEKAVAPARMPLGSDTYCEVPERFTALPVRPATHVAPPLSVAVLPLP